MISRICFCHNPKKETNWWNTTWTRSNINNHTHTHWLTRLFTQLTLFFVSVFSSSPLRHKPFLSLGSLEPFGYREAGLKKSFVVLNNDDEEESRKNAKPCGGKFTQVTDATNYSKSREERSVWEGRGEPIFSPPPLPLLHLLFRSRCLLSPHTHTHTHTHKHTHAYTHTHKHTHTHTHAHTHTHTHSHRTSHV